MQATVFGASGKVGQLVVAELLAQGHEVMAFVHSQSPFTDANKLQVYRGDIHTASDVTAALQGSQAVISTLGSWGTKSKDILASAMQLVIPAMQQNGLTRIVTLTGSAAHVSSDPVTTGNKISHAVFSMVAPKIIVDGERHIELLQASKLDWTVVRAPVIAKPSSDSYTLNSQTPKAWEKISRSAVAKALVDQLSATDFVRQAPHIHHS